MKDKVANILSGINGVRDAHAKLDAELSGGPAAYYFGKLNEYIDGLFSFAQFSVGGRVSLAKDVDCNDKPGWVGSEHFLKKGAAATISKVDFANGRFHYGVVFDNETWLDKNVARPVSSKHEYWLPESAFRALA